MNVRELKAALDALAPEHDDLVVVAEGCDCDGDVQSVTVEGNPPTVLWPTPVVYLHRKGSYG